MENENSNVKIMIPTLEGFSSVDLNSIIYLSGESSSSWVHLDHQKIYVPRTLRHFEIILKEYNFHRIHKSYLINLNYIQSVKKGKLIKVTMSNGDELSVSKNKKDAFSEKLTEIAIVI